MSGQGFEFTPGGVVPLVESAHVPGAIIPAAGVVEQIKAAAAAQAQPVAPSVPKASPLKPVSRKSYVAELKARLRLLEREIRSKAKLEREAAELRRMLAAAKQPPAQVADIHARKTG